MAVAVVVASELALFVNEQLNLQSKLDTKDMLYFWLEYELTDLENEIYDYMTNSREVFPGQEHSGILCTLLLYLQPFSSEKSAIESMIL